MQITNYEKTVRINKSMVDTRNVGYRGVFRTLSNI